MTPNFKEGFLFFKNKKVFSINKIEYWLLKYSDFYITTYEFVYNQHLFKSDDGSTVRLPNLKETTDQEFFLNLYKALDTISQFHRNESYFEQELIKYEKIKNSQSDLKNWLTKNEDLGTVKYVSFLTDYLDYDKNDEEEHLIIYIYGLEDFEIYVERQNFKNTIDFLEKFNELYWHDENVTETKE